MLLMTTPFRVTGRMPVHENAFLWGSRIAQRELFGIVSSSLPTTEELCYVSVSLPSPGCLYHTFQMQPVQVE